MAEAIYLLCTATSITCAGLLLNGFRRTRLGLLFWSGLCFMGLTLNNALLFLDLVIVPSVDLSVWRGVVALAAMMVLLYGMVAESR